MNRIKDNFKEMKNYYNSKRYNSYEYICAHLKKQEARKGGYFRVWAPNVTGVFFGGHFL